MSKSQTLRDLVMERLVVAADEIFALFERTIAEYEEEVLRSKLSLETHNKGVQTLSVNLEVGPSPGQTLCIKQEEEPPLEFPLTSVSVKTEDNVEMSFLLQQEPPEENREEPGCSLYLQSEKDKQTYSCSDTDDSDDWEPSAKRSTTCNGQQSEMTISSLMCPAGVQADVLSQERQMMENQEETLEQQFREERPGCSNTLVKDWGFHSFTERKLFSCSVCKMCFGSKYELEAHMRIHKLFSCPECGERFTHPNGKNKHISVVHKGKRPFSCPMCEKAFIQRSDVIRHMRIHTGEKPFSCTFCNMCFNVKSSLKRHIQRAHSFV